MFKTTITSVLLITLTACTATSGYESETQNSQTTSSASATATAPPPAWTLIDPTTPNTSNPNSSYSYPYYWYPYADSYSPSLIPSTPAPAPRNEPNVYYNSPYYWNDPNLPVNRGHWVNVPTFPGQTQSVWSTSPDRFRFGPLPEDYPTYRGGYLQPEYRWNQQYRR